ncbi:MAG: ABC transporter substrate-binding protein [Alphaproteobacteria bacterium]
MTSLVLSALVLPVAAAEESTPNAVVDTFYGALIGVMKQGGGLGFQGRYARLEPVIDKTFNLDFMGRLAIGPQWSTLTPDQKKRALDTFHRFTVSNYASQFKSFGGENFVVGRVVPTANQNVIVETRMILSKGDEIQFNYLMRNFDGNWQIIDVFLDGSISEVARRRSEFTSVLSRDGIEGLVNLLERKIKTLGAG